jgi:hypothetical protein
MVILALLRVLYGSSIHFGMIYSIIKYFKQNELMLKTDLQYI